MLVCTMLLTLGQISGDGLYVWFLPT